LYGQRLAQQQFPQANDPQDALGRGTLTQTFKSSDLSLKQSPIFGIKGGYFFNDEKLPWLGVELEAFTSTPTIKSQTLSTVQDVTYQPNTPASAQNCVPPVPFPNCPAYVVNQSTRLAAGVESPPLCGRIQCYRPLPGQAVPALCRGRRRRVLFPVNEREAFRAAVVPA
ncbi:MAG: porin family protein, partial [Nitrospiraceae bacterium]|nr:porin family protein [Nitrospiraceae bacterium]